MTLTGNIRKYWTLRKTRRQELLKRQSTQKKTSIISMEYPSNYQVFGNQYYEKVKQRKQPPKLQHHQTESTKAPTSIVPNKYATKVSQSERTLKYFDPLQTHKYHTHTLTRLDNHRYFFLLRTQMITNLQLDMSMSLWPMLTSKPSLS